MHMENLWRTPNISSYGKIINGKIHIKQFRKFTTYTHIYFNKIKCICMLLIFHNEKRWYTFVVRIWLLFFPSSIIHFLCCGFSTSLYAKQYFNGGRRRYKRITPRFWAGNKKTSFAREKKGKLEKWYSGVNFFPYLEYFMDRSHQFTS